MQVEQDIPASVLVRVYLLGPQEKRPLWNLETGSERQVEE